MCGPHAYMYIPMCRPHAYMYIPMSGLMRHLEPQDKLVWARLQQCLSRCTTVLQLVATRHVPFTMPEARACMTTQGSPNVLQCTRRNAKELSHRFTVPEPRACMSTQGSPNVLNAFKEMPKSFHIASQYLMPALVRPNKVRRVCLQNPCPI